MSGIPSVHRLYVNFEPKGEGAEELRKRWAEGLSGRAAEGLRDQATKPPISMQMVYSRSRPPASALSPDLNQLLSLPTQSLSCAAQSASTPIPSSASSAPHHSGYAAAAPGAFSGPQPSSALEAEVPVSSAPQFLKYSVLQPLTRTHLLVRPPALDPISLFPLRFVPPPLTPEPTISAAPELHSISGAKVGATHASAPHLPNPEASRRPARSEFHIVMLRNCVLAGLHDQLRGQRDEREFNEILREALSEVCSLQYRELLRLFNLDPLTCDGDLSALIPELRGLDERLKTKDHVDDRMADGEETEPRTQLGEGLSQQGFAQRSLWTAESVTELCRQCRELNGGTMPQPLADVVFIHVINQLLEDSTAPPPLSPLAPSAEATIINLVRMVLPDSSVSSLEPLTFCKAVSTLKWEGKPLGSSAVREAAILHLAMNSVA